MILDYTGDSISQHDMASSSRSLVHVVWHTGHAGRW